MDGPTPTTSSAPSAAKTPATGLEFRFALLYGGLATVLIASIVGLFIVLRQPTPPPAPAWSTWRPPAGSTASMETAVTDHVAAQYKLNKAGAPLVAIVPSAPEGTHGTTVTPVSTIGFLSSATASSCCTRVVATTGNIQDQFCGLGTACAITRGTASLTRGRLVRREALELALYTFKYVPSVNALIAYMPPVPGAKTFTMLYLERSNLQPELSRPLAKTLPLATPPLPTMPDPLEKKTIDKLTLPVEFSFIQYKDLGDGTQALIISPTTT